MDPDWVRDFIAGVGSEPVSRISRYELGRVLGEGGSAVVYEAYDPELGRHVALKVLRSSFAPTVTPAESASFLAATVRLRREAQAVARLSHPNIVSIHEVGRDYIAMDLVVGTTFAEAGPKLSGDERLRVIETVARAVAYAHEQGVVHRDLKPSNVLIETSGRVVLTDFGIAKVTDADALTQHDRVMGTPQYMAPEQVRGEPAGPAADVWALGVLLHEALTGARPFQGETDLQTYDLITRGPAPTVPGPLGGVAARALARRPQDRYPNAAAFADDLARCRRGEPPHVPVRWRRKLPVAALAAALIASGIIVASVMAGRRTGAALQAGLAAEYFSGRYLSGPSVRRTDERVAFVWKDGERPVAEIPSEDFSVRWTGRLRAVHSEPTKLCLRSDDGHRLWLDGKLVLDAWHEHSALIDCHHVDLVRGRLYDLRVEYFQAIGRALVELWWESPSLTPPAVVGAPNLFAPEGAAP